MQKMLMTHHAAVIDFSILHHAPVQYIDKYYILMTYNKHKCTLFSESYRLSQVGSYFLGMLLY